MRKRFKKVLISIALIAILMSVGVFSVYSNGGSSGNDSGGDGTGNACSSCSCTYHDADTYGVRISLVYWNTGERVENVKSIDVFATGSLTGQAANYTNAVYTLQNDNSAKYNKVEMITQQINQVTNPALSLTTWDGIPKVTVDKLGWQNAGVSFNYGSIASSISYSQLINSLYNVMQREVDAYAAADYTDAENKMPVTLALFRKFDLDFTKFTKADLSNMHLMFEPIVTFAIEGTNNTYSSYRLFYGTITQVAYAFQQYNCNSDDWKNWSMADSLLKDKYGVLVYASSPCNTAGDMKYCYLNGWEAGSNVTGSGRNRREALTGVIGNSAGLSDSNAKKSNGVGFIWLGSLNMPQRDTCASVVEYLNDLYKNDKIAQDEYDNYILQVKEGRFEQQDDQEKVKYKIDTPQEFEFLIKENYDKYNEGLAACADREKVSLDCEAAINYINSNYRRGTQAYHNAVDQVEAGTFSYEEYDGTTVTIDKAYSYNMLNKTVYTRNGGVAQCNDIIINVCAGADPAVVNIDECETGKTFFGDINDENLWLVCEIAYTKDGKNYSSDNTGHEAVETTNGGIVGNAEYCEVFCYEEFETAFPTHVYDVKAGQTFTWGTPDGMFGTVRIRKKCSNQNYVKGQQGYRFEEWEEDYKDNEEAMIEHFMKNGAYESMISGITSSSSRYNTCDYRCSTCHRKDGSSYKCNCGYRGCPRYRATARSSGTSESYSHSAYIGSVTGSVSTQTYSVSGYMDSASARAAAEAGLKSKLQSLAASEEAKYSQKKNEEAELIEKIEQCTNNIKYVHKATIQFTFKEPVNSVYGANSRSFEFNDDFIVEGSFNESNVNTSKCTRKTIYKYSCSGYASGVTCTPEAKQVWDCTVVTWDVNGNYTYKYPVEEFQWYSLKIDSTLLNEKDKGSEDEAFFYSIGFGLPTALSLTDGTYELKTVVYDLGDDAEFSGGNPQYERPEDTHFDPLGLPVDTNVGSKKGFEYICTYEVDNEVFGYDCQYDSSGKLIYSSPEYCDPTKDDDSDGSLLGIDITYRLVTLLSDGDTLDKAFPGKDGNGRDPGSNWRGVDEDIMHILRDDVYNDPAMYEIMLDVNAIQKIRKDNQTYFNSGKDPYASYYDANNNQKVYCAEEGDQKYCASDFISELYNGSGLNYRLLGTCLPTGNTLERAEEVLENGCETHYTYPAINWTR